MSSKAYCVTSSVVVERCQHSDSKTIQKAHILQKIVKIVQFFDFSSRLELF